MKIKALVVSCMVLASCFVYGQQVSDLGSYKKNFKEGNFLLLEQNHRMALQYFKHAYKYDSANANVNFNIGFCYLYDATSKHLAEKYLEVAVKNVSPKYSEENLDEKHAPVEAYFYLGRAYQLDGKLDEADKMFDTYESFLKSGDKEGHDELAHYKQTVKNARTNMAAPLNAKITNMGDSINSADPEYSAVLSADERMMIYTRRSKENVGGTDLDIDGYPYEDIVVSYKKDDGHWTHPVSLGQYINTIGHEASVALSADGQTLILFRGDNGGDLYYSTYDGTEWGLPLKFGSNINSPTWEPSACFSRDGNTLYFVSDRPGGLGGRDIYRCVKLPNGQWSLALNLGPSINTPYDEESPFMSPDGITFYYASQGHNSMGGFDIMFSILGEDGQFSPPLNMGYPINTTDDDLFLVASPDNKRLYYSSAHEDPKAFGEKDIYMITYEGITSNPLALFKGQIKPGPCDSLPENIVIVVSNIESGEIVGNYRPQHKTGAFSVIIPPGSKYLFSYQQDGTEIFNEEVFVPGDIAYEEIQKALNLKPHKLCNGQLMDDSTKKAVDLSLNLQVLNNKKDNKPVANAKVKITNKAGVVKEATTDAKGKLEKIKLEKDKNYDINVSLAAKKTLYSFSTVGASGTKVYDKTVFLEKTAEENIKLTLNVTVLNTKKLKQAVKNAKVLLIGTDGSKYEGVTDAKGILKNAPLAFESSYELTAEADGIVSSKHLVTTNGVRKSKVFAETIYLQDATETPLIADNSSVDGTKFKFIFKYNMNEVDETAPEFVTFINNLVKQASANGGKVKLEFTCSASTVPTHAFKDNVQLSESRLKRTQEKVFKALAAKGITKANVTIVKEKAFVSGPEYKNDKDVNKATYEKFQFAEIKGI